MAIAFALATTKKVSLADLKDYKKNYREGKTFQKYITKHPNHNQELNHLIMRIQGRNYFEQIDIQEIQSQVETRIANIFKKVKFYQNRKSDGSYIVPGDLKKYLTYSDDSELLKEIRADVEPKMKSQIDSIHK